MRLSLKKDAHVALSSPAWQEIRLRSGRDDKFVGIWTYAHALKNRYLDNLAASGYFAV